MFHSSGILKIKKFSSLKIQADPRLETFHWGRSIYFVLTFQRQDISGLLSGSTPLSCRTPCLVKPAWQGTGCLYQASDRHGSLPLPLLPHGRLLNLLSGWSV